MNIGDFTYILQNPQSLKEEQVMEIKSIIDEFPYFQPARALYLKALKNRQSFKYNQELKKTAAYTTDRSILFDYITSEVFLQNQISEQIKQNFEHVKDFEVKDAEDISVDKSVTIDDRLREQIQESKEVLDPQLFERKVEVSKVADFKDSKQKPDASLLEFDTNNIEPLPEETLELGKPFDFDKNERHSFNEWLKITSFKPIQREDEKPKDDQQQLSRKKKFELIDQFIVKNPKIKPSKSSPENKDIASSRMIQPEALMTETLARIYVEQKNYKKAIQSYKILSLKYPEKSGFFADQIKAIKKLQDKNN